MPESIWLMVILLLQLITIFALVILYQRYQLLKMEQFPDQADFNQQLQTFIKEVEKENEAYYLKLISYVNQLEDRRLQGLDENRISMRPEEHEAEEELESAEERVTVGSTDHGEIKPTTHHSDVLTIEEEGMRPQEERRETERTTQIDQVIQLLEEGCSPQEIARQLDMGVGEVELTINLHGSHRV